MRKLLRAHFSRILKNGLFWLGAGGMGLCGALVSISNYSSMLKYPGESFSLEGSFFFFCPLIGMFAAVVVNLYLGKEYSDGTMRNKLMVGHRRGAVYASSLLVACAAVAFMEVCGAACVLLLGLPMFGPFQMERAQLAGMLLSALMLGVSSASICTAIAMNVQSRAAAAVVALVLMLVMLFVASYIGGRLDEPEMIADAILYQDGGVIQSEAYANPRYLEGNIRTVLEWIYDLLPAGQGARLSNLETQRLERLPYLSLALGAGVSALGFVFYRKRDIR